MLVVSVLFTTILTLDPRSYRKRVRLEKKGIDGKIQSLKDTIAGMQIEVARLEAQRNR